MSSPLQNLPDHILRAIIERQGRDFFVVLNASGTNVLYDPGLDRPFYTKNQKFADQVARETHGHAVTLSHAIEVLTRQAIKKHS